MSTRVDMDEFNKTLRVALSISKRKMSEAINSRGYFVAKRAKENTPIGSREVIQSTLGATLESEKINRKGKTVRRYSYKPTPLVYKLINAQRKKDGKAMLWGRDMEGPAKQFIQRRLRAIGSLRSGWNGAIRSFARAAKEFISVGGPIVKMPAKVKLAREGWTPQAEMEYRLAINKPGGKQIDPRVVAALELAFGQELTEMKRHIEGKMREAMKESGVTVS